MEGRVEELFHVVDLMTETERIMRDYYSVGSRLFPEFHDLFNSLSQEEEQHAKLFEEIRQGIEENSQDWELGNFSAKTIEVCNHNLRKNLSEIEEGAVSPIYALTFICSVEQSLIERHAGHALRCSDDECRKKLDIITSGFDGHYRRLQKILDKHFPYGAFREASSDHPV